MMTESQSAAISRCVDDADGPRAYELVSCPGDEAVQEPRGAAILGWDQDLGSSAGPLEVSVPRSYSMKSLPAHRSGEPDGWSPGETACTMSCCNNHWLPLRTLRFWAAVQSISGPSPLQPPSPPLHNAVSGHCTADFKL